MSDNLNISDFTYSKGLNLGNANQSFTYLYGLSDFWQYMFQDTSTTNLLLEATSVQASDIYSNFLQLCTGISIADIDPSAKNQLKLEIISSALNLPTNIPIVSATWTSGAGGVGGFSTIKVDRPEGFSVGDTISINNVISTTYYDLGYGIDEYPIDAGGNAYQAGGVSWNGTFTITNITADGHITYYQPSATQQYVGGGSVSVVNIGVETYQLPDNINTTRFIANRAFLPTIVLEENVDYFINPDSARISFAQPLSSYGFPSRVGPIINTTTYSIGDGEGDGEVGTTTAIATAEMNEVTSTTAVTHSIEYPLWFVDVTYDEDLIYSQYPLLLGLTKPAISNESYRNFLYGLYYMYTSGPTLSIIEKGINLCLGVPLARNDETMLVIRPYLGLDQFIVITDLNSYVIPSGLSPSVAVGQVIKVGDELAKWVELADYYSYGAWWRDFPVSIPAELMPIVPTGFSRSVGGLLSVTSGATLEGIGNGIDENEINGEEGLTPYTIDDYADWIMINYLRYNTFLVKVNVTISQFIAAQQFEDITQLLLELKPKNTFPIFSYVPDTAGITVQLTAVNNVTLAGTVV